MDGNRFLVEHLIANGSLSSPRLIDAFLRCDRVRFVPETLCNSAYGDYPLQIGEGQTISQPTTVAIMLELLDPRPGDRVLDIGSGSGWTTALIACAVGETGFVEGVERLERLVAYGRRNLLRSGVKNASIEPAKPAVLGKPGELYDRILVSACAPKMPRELLEQLKIGGKLVMPVRDSVWRITKLEQGKVDAYEVPGFRFVPLVVA